MNEPRRWLDDGAELTAEERRVLEAGSRLRPPTSAKHTVRRALSAALGAGALASGSTASGALVGVSFAKGLIVGLVVGGGVSVGVLALRSPEASAPRPAPVVVAPKLKPLAPSLASAAPAAATPDPAVIDDAPAASKVSNRPAPEVIESPTPALPRSEPSTGALPDLIDARPLAPSGAGFALAESRRVAEARALLRRGDARAALTLLDRIRAEFPSGLLVQEREALAIEALNAAGDRKAARARASEFLKRFPESPHASAARAVLAE